MAKAEIPRGIPEDELYDVLRSRVRDANNQSLSTKLSKEAHRVIAHAAKRYGVDGRKALEIIVRQWRELNK